MAILLKVRNSQGFIEKLNNLLDDNSIGEKSEDIWLIERFSNVNFYTFYSPKGMWNNKAWFRVCPDDARRSFNESKNVSYTLIFRLHGTKSDDMTKELYCFYHSRFVELILNNLMDEIKDLAITASAEDIQLLDRFKNYDWR